MCGVHKIAKRSPPKRRRRGSAPLLSGMRYPGVGKRQTSRDRGRSGRALLARMQTLSGGRRVRWRVQRYLFIFYQPRPTRAAPAAASSCARQRGGGATHGFESVLSCSICLGRVEAVKTNWPSAESFFWYCSDIKRGHCDSSHNKGCDKRRLFPGDAAAPWAIVEHWRCECSWSVIASAKAISEFGESSRITIYGGAREWACNVF